MMTKEAAHSAMRGSWRRASAIFVMGPTATRWISPGDACRVLMIRSTAWAPSRGSVASGRMTSPSPPTPCTSAAFLASRTRGSAAPAATGTSVNPRYSRSSSALRVVFSSATFPPTVVTATRSSSGSPWASASARASSSPGSQSNRSFFTVMPPAYDRCDAGRISPMTAETPAADLPSGGTEPGIDPHDLEVTLRVLASLNELDEENPDFVTVRQATARMFKSVKQNRRLEKRAIIAAADRAVVAATATGAADRIDDETRGIPLASGTDAPTAGTLQKSRPCYICKQHYTRVDAFYHQLCPDCAAFSHSKRDARTDLSGKRALLTGGRAKIGMYIALRLLRDGAHTTITTRFPRDAVRRFSSLADSAEWLHRLTVVGIDLRDPAQVIGLADSVAEQGPLDILINNAAQTVRRSPGAYSALVDAEL